MTRLEHYIEQYGPLAGPKLYHALQSRAAYAGVSKRRRRALEVLTGKPTRIRKRAAPAPPQPLLDGFGPGPDSAASE